VTAALPVVGHAISRVEFDYAVSFLTDGDAFLRIEQAFELRGPAAPAAVVRPPDAAAHAGALVQLLRGTVERADVDDRGTLRLGVSGGREIVVPPDNAYEAWTFAGARGEHVVCLPGGGVTGWGAEEGA
jgi:hypothetical protein